MKRAQRLQRGRPVSELLREPHRPLGRQVLHALPIIVLVSVVMIAAEHWGWTKPLELSVLDRWIRLNIPYDARYVAMVTIGDEEYASPDLFGSTSPLNSHVLARLLGAILQARPAVVCVDIDLSDSDLAPIQSVLAKHAAVPMVFYRSVDQDGALTPRQDRIREELQRDSALPLFPLDDDGLVRRYERVITTSEGPLPSLPWAAALAYCNGLSTGRPPQARKRACSGINERSALENPEVILNLTRERYGVRRLPVRDVLALEGTDAWGDGGPLSGMVVVLGGSYRAARDDYATPVGRLAGAELVAQAIEAELRGRSIRHAAWPLILALEILSGLVVVLVHHRFRPRTALVISLIAIPSLASASGFFAFSTMGVWANTIPVTLAALIHQLYDNAREYRMMYAELEKRCRVQKRT